MPSMGAGLLERKRIYKLLHACIGLTPMLQRTILPAHPQTDSSMTRARTHAQAESYMTHARDATIMPGPRLPSDHIAHFLPN